MRGNFKAVAKVLKNMVDSSRQLFEQGQLLAELLQAFTFTHDAEESGMAYTSDHS